MEKISWVLGGCMGINVKIKFIQMIFINEDGNLASVEDEAWMFKFVRR